MYIDGTVDITRRKELEILQSEQAQEISILYGALSKFAGKPDNVKSLTKQVAEIVVTDFHAYECALFLLSEDQSQAIQNAYCGPGIIAGEDCLSMESTSLITTAIKTGAIIYAPDVHKDTRYRADDSKTRSEFVVPLQAHGKVIGVINVESPNLDDFSERTRRLVATFAQNATVAIQNALLVDSLEVSLANLKESQARINFFLEHTAEGVYRIDYEPPISIHLPIEKQFKLSVEHGKIAECNEAFA